MSAMFGPAYRMNRDANPPLWRRCLALMLDGLRAVDRPPLPVPPPPAESAGHLLAPQKGRALTDWPE